MTKLSRLAELADQLPRVMDHKWGRLGEIDRIVETDCSDFDHAKLAAHVHSLNKVFAIQRNETYELADAVNKLRELILEASIDDLPMQRRELSDDPPWTVSSCREFSNDEWTQFLNDIKKELGIE